MCPYTYLYGSDAFAMRALPPRSGCRPCMVTARYPAKAMADTCTRVGVRVRESEKKSRPPTQCAAPLIAQLLDGSHDYRVPDATGDTRQSRAAADVRSRTRLRAYSSQDCTIPHCTIPHSTIPHCTIPPKGHTCATLGTRWCATVSLGG